MTLKQIIKYVIAWRVILTYFAWVAAKHIPFKDSFPYREIVLKPFGNELFYSWANFDGVHYLGIAQRGYWAQYTQAFFPFYPILIRFGNVFHNELLAGLVISHISLIAALYYLYKLIKLDHSSLIAKKTILLILCFPTSFFFASLYTESLFLLLCVLSFYFMRTKKESKAYLCAAVASATRLVGIFLLPALLYEKWLTIPVNKRSNLRYVAQQLLPVTFASAGLFIYMIYLEKVFSDALYFLNAQPAFGAGRSADKLILLYQVIYRYIKMALTVDPTTLLYLTISQEFIASILFLCLIGYGLKKIRTSYTIFCFFSFIAPTLTGTFSSMPRYVLLLFPSFVVLALITNKNLTKIIIIISVILLAINISLFTRGYWVA